MATVAWPLGKLGTVAAPGRFNRSGRLNRFVFSTCVVTFAPAMITATPSAQAWPPPGHGEQQQHRSGDSEGGEADRVERPRRGQLDELIRRFARRWRPRPPVGRNESGPHRCRARPPRRHTAVRTRRESSPATGPCNRRPLPAAGGTTRSTSSNPLAPSDDRDAGSLDGSAIPESMA